MKLNDPFGRQERRHQAGYEAMRDTLRQSGVVTPQAAEELIRRSRKRVLVFLAAGGVVLLLVFWLLPGALPVAALVVLLLMVAAINSIINGQRYIRRYIDEDLRQK